MELSLDNVKVWIIDLEGMESVRGEYAKGHIATAFRSLIITGFTYPEALGDFLRPWGNLKGSLEGLEEMLKGIFERRDKIMRMFINAVTGGEGTDLNKPDPTKDSAVQ